MSNKTNFNKPIPPGKSRSKNKQTNAIPSPVMTSTDIKRSQSENLSNNYSRKGQTPNSYRYQNQQRGPPRKALPNFSQTPTPINSKPSINSNTNVNGDHSPLPLEMSQTSHVGTNHLNQPISNATMKRTLSANDMLDYVPVINKNGHKPIPHYQKREKVRKISDSNSKKQEHIHSSTETSIFIPPPPERTFKGTQMQHSYSSESQNVHKHTKQPSIGAMKHLIERAETFGQNRQSMDRSKVHSNQATQMPANNAIFDETHSVSHSESKEEMNRQSVSKSNSHRLSNVILPSNNRLSYTQSSDVQMKELKNEISELENLLKHKRRQLNDLEKERLEQSIGHIKPITLLKRLNEFCTMANEEELDIIQCILEQSVQ